jgi:hypothetical protein
VTISGTDRLYDTAHYLTLLVLPKLAIRNTTQLLPFVLTAADDRPIRRLATHGCGRVGTDAVSVDVACPCFVYQLL